MKHVIISHKNFSNKKPDSFLEKSGFLLQWKKRIPYGIKNQ